MVLGAGHEVSGVPTARLRPGLRKHGGPMTIGKIRNAR